MSVWSKLKHDKTAIVCCLILICVVVVGIFANQIAPNDPLAVDVTMKFQKPSMQYPLGNDHLGRCVLSRLIHGIRYSVLLIILAMLITITIGALVGLISGFAGGIIDEVCMRICDIMLSFPTEVMTLAMVGILGVGLKNIIIACIIMGWAWYARVIRSSVRQYKNLNYVRFAKASGCGFFYIIFKHIFPSIMSEIVVFASNKMSSLILSIAGLSFLGLGVQAPAPEWGMMLNEAKEVMIINPTQMLPPGIAVMIVSLSFSFLGDCIRDAMDPKYVKMKKVRKFKLKRKKAVA